VSSILKQLENFIIDVLETVIIALSIFAVIYLFAFQPHEVNGESMDGIGKFHNGQYILTDKLTYKFRSPVRGEVIVFKYPLDERYDYIKRIVGLPGEEIMLKDSKIYIYNAQHPDGFALNESEYLANTVVTSSRAFLEEGVKIKIPDTDYFVMGDNRPQSADSRTWGFVPKQEIIGRSLFRYWPPQEIGLIHSPNNLEK
jgi:signal peptidase I